MNTEYYIPPVLLLPSQCPVFVSRKYGQPILSALILMVGNPTYLLEREVPKTL
jgi:hypothetical protein